MTQIRSLLLPQPMKELRVKNTYTEPKQVRAAQGVKITAKDLEKAIAGLNLLVAYHPDEVDICKDDVSRELKSALGRIKLQDRGVYVQASTLGSLEALLEFLKTSEIPVNAPSIDFFQIFLILIILELSVRQYPDWTRGEEGCDEGVDYVGA